MATAAIRKLGKRSWSREMVLDLRRILMRTAEWALIVVLGIAGLYFLLFHRDPMPLNHEAIGLGTLHFVHDLIGIGLFGVAGFVWWHSRRSARIKAPL